MSELTSPRGGWSLVSGSLWWLGWHPLVAPVIGAFAGLALGNALAIPAEVLLGLHPLATMGGLVVVGALAGVGAWYRGTDAVNERYRGVLDLHRGGVPLPGSDAVAFALVGEGSGSIPFVRPSRGYDATFVVLREDSVAVHPGTLDVAERRPDVEDGAIEVPYDHVESARYDGSSLVLHTTWDDRLQYASDGEPTALLDALTDRVDGSR